MGEDPFLFGIRRIIMAFAVSFREPKSSIFASSFMNKDPPVSSLQNNLYTEPVFCAFVSIFYKVAPY